jgi:hypothetical protein
MQNIPKLFGRFVSFLAFFLFIFKRSRIFVADKRKEDV